MHIIKGQTHNFNDYKIFQITDQNHGCPKWLRWLFPVKEKSSRLFRIIEADEATGRIVQQVCDENYRPVFTNGIEDVSLTDEVKVLLTVQDIYTSFIKKGYVPKTIVYFCDKLEIEYNGPQISQAERTSLKAIK